MPIWRGLKRREDLERVSYSRDEAEGGGGRYRSGGYADVLLGLHLDNANKAILLGKRLQRPGQETASHAEEKIEFLAAVAR